MIFRIFTSFAIHVFTSYLCQGQESGGDPFFGGDMNDFMPPFATEPEPPSDAVLSAIESCGEVIDAHLHESLFFSTADALISEMDRGFVSRGVLMAVYGAKASPFSDDPNTSVQQFAEESDGRIYGLVSLNTTAQNWTEEIRVKELNRLATFLEKPGVVGAKVAPPHTCLELGSQTMRDIVDTISKSSRKLLYIHVGTTPFCGPFGLITSGMIGCCGREYVDPRYLEILIAQHTDTTFVLLHAGHDFLGEDSEYYYDNKMVDYSIQVAREYPNVYLEISAFLKQPRANVTMQKIVDGGLMHRIIYGSDVNHFPGEMLPYLELTIPAMVDAGFTEEAMCSTLRGNAISVFGLREGESQSPTIEPTTMPGGEDTSAAFLVKPFSVGGLLFALLLCLN